MTTSLKWIATIFPTEKKPLDYIIECFKKRESSFRYLCIGLEVCPKTHKEHLQCCFYLKHNKWSREKLQRVTGIDHFCKIPDGNEFQNQKYCEKDGNLMYSFGKPETEQGRRTDIETIKEIIKSGGDINDIIEASTSYQSMRCGELILKYKPQTGIINKYVEFIPCVNKSKGYADLIKRIPLPCFTISDINNWEGYTNQPSIIIRMDKSVTVNKLEYIISDIPYKVNCKGGSINIVSTNIYILSNRSLEYYLLNKDEYEEYSNMITFDESFIHPELQEIYYCINKSLDEKNALSKK